MRREKGVWVEGERERFVVRSRSVKREKSLGGRWGGQRKSELLCPATAAAVADLERREKRADYDYDYDYCEMVCSFVRVPSVKR